MSKIGKEPIKIPDGVEVNVDGRIVSVKGPKGNLELKVSRRVKVKVNKDAVKVTRKSDQLQARADHGLYRTLIANMMIGVTEGYLRQLEMKGLGYRAELKGPNKLILNIGFVHPVEIEAPEGVSFKVDENTRITVEGSDKEKVGSVAAKIRSLRKPEPYKGKGIRYIDEVVRKKTPKMAKALEEGGE